MFKAIKDNKIIAINETGNFPCLVHDSVEEDTEHYVSDYMQVNGEYVLTSSDEAIEQKKTEVRAIRNQYLYDTDKYIAVTDFPITEEERQQYKDYREYLRNYPETRGLWWEKNPMSFDEWKQQETEEQEEPLEQEEEITNE